MVEKFLRFGAGKACKQKLAAGRVLSKIQSYKLNLESEMKTQRLRGRVILAGMLALICISVATKAQEVEDYPANWCRNGLFASDRAEFKSAKIGGNRAARVHFFKDDDGCPSYTVKCETKSYLINGDQVLVSRKYGQWMCAWYQPQKGSETVGWLPADKLSVSEESARPALANWIGLWKYDRKSLDIRRDGKTGRLKVKGYAIWEGSRDNVHVGGVEAAAQPEGNKLILVEEECRVTLKLVGDYLVADDNSECGGVNVRFNGVFRKGRSASRSYRSKGRALNSP